MTPPNKHDPQLLDARFEQALVYAFRLHSGQKRKQSQVPYIAHLLGVTGIVLEDGGNEDEAIAALLHDAVEDQGGLETLEEIRMRFGSKVADLVLALSDSYTQPKPPWRERKQVYIDSIPGANPSEIRISLADKVYNARAILRDLRLEGDRIWTQFNGGKEGTLWYYQQLVLAFQTHGEQPLLSELIRILEQIRFESDQGKPHEAD
jgi:(p)ppGpp synthase/HD superfamily hydrolase